MGPLILHAHFWSAALYCSSDHSFRFTSAVTQGYSRSVLNNTGIFQEASGNRQLVCSPLMSANSSTYVRARPPCHAAYVYAHCAWTDASAFRVCASVARWHRRVLILLLWSQVPRVRNSQGACSLFRGCQGSGYNQQNAQFYVCGSFCRKDLECFFSLKCFFRIVGCHVRRWCFHHEITFNFRKSQWQ